MLISLSLGNNYFLCWFINLWQREEKSAIVTIRDLYEIYRSQVYYSDRTKGSANVAHFCYLFPTPTSPTEISKPHNLTEFILHLVICCTLSSFRINFQHPKSLHLPIPHAVEHYEWFGFLIIHYVTLQ